MKNEKKFNKRNLKQKEKGFIAGGLALALALSGTFAFLTDRASYNEDISGAKFGIKVEGETDNSTVVMPEYPRDFNFTVTSTGNVDADIRERVMVFGQDGDEYLPVSADNVEFGLYNDTDDADLFADKTIGKDAILYTKKNTLKAGGSLTENGDFKITSKATNEYIDKNYIISILVEAKQKKAADWTTVAVETINMGAEKDGVALDMQDAFNMVKAVAKGDSISVNPDDTDESEGNSIYHVYKTTYNNTGKSFGEGTDYPFFYNPSSYIKVSGSDETVGPTMIYTSGEESSLKFKKGQFNEDAVVEKIGIIYCEEDKNNPMNPIKHTVEFPVTEQYKVYDTALDENKSVIGGYWDVTLNFVDGVPTGATLTSKEMEFNKILSHKLYTVRDADGEEDREEIGEDDTSVRPITITLSAYLKDGYTMKCENTGETLKYGVNGMSADFVAKQNGTYTFKVYDANGNAVDSTEYTVNIHNIDPYYISAFLNSWGEGTSEGGLTFNVNENPNITSVKAYYAETEDGNREEFELSMVSNVYYSAKISKDGYYFVVVSLNNGTTKEFSKQVKGFVTSSTNTVANQSINVYNLTQKWK